MCNYKAILFAASVVALVGCHQQAKSPSYVEVPPIQSIPQAVEQINLTSDTLFKFNTAHMAALTPTGRAKLDELVHALNKGYISLQSVELVGHTDRLGKAEYNYNLGMQRAKSVHDYLISRGVPDNVISYKSVGENQPVSNGCAQVTPRAKLIQCLQPDRRVSVTVRGMKNAN